MGEVTTDDNKSTCTLDDKHKLLEACDKGDGDKVAVLLQKEGVIDALDEENRTPLHIACLHGHNKIVEKILDSFPERKQEMLDATDKGGCTPLHHACEGGNDNFVKKILSLAHSEGHTETVKLLLEHGAKVNVKDKKNRTPLYFASKKGREQVVKLLLKKKADIECDNNDLNPLEVAVEEGHEDTAMAIVKSDKWKDALRNHKTEGKSDDFRSCCCSRNEQTDPESHGKCVASRTQFTTPMRRIIKKMPDVAEVVFDRCCETKRSPYDDDYEITYDFKFIEDFDLDWTNSLKYSSQNHCLNILADSPSAELLSHPLARTLLDHKWNTYGRIFYYANVIFYFLFVILQSSFALSVHSPSSGKCYQVFGIVEGRGETVFGNTNDTFIDCFPEQSFVPQTFVSFASPCLIACSIVMILREAFEVVWFRLKYFTNIINYGEVLLFIFTIIIASVRSSECYCTRPWQWRIGVIAVFLGWIALIFSIRKLPVVGIYVVMFIKICYNFMKVLVLALMLILAFAFPFYMTFYDAQDRAEGIRTPFITPWRSIFKTIMMTMGEYTMDSVLQQNNERNSADVQYPVFAFSLLVVFVILMPILFLNLLIGLAVGDTDEIRKSAHTHRQILKVKFTLPIEEVLRKLPKIGEELKKKLDKLKKEKVKPNDKQSWRMKLFDYLTWTDKHYKTEPPATVADVKNQNRPLAEEMKDLRSSVSEEVKGLHSAMSEEVKDLRSSMDQLLAIVKSINERQGEGGRAGGGGLGARGLERRWSWSN